MQTIHNKPKAQQAWNFQAGTVLRYVTGHLLGHALVQNSEPQGHPLESSLVGFPSVCYKLS